jgi:hypothetical protein
MDRSGLEVAMLSLAKRRGMANVEPYVGLWLEENPSDWYEPYEVENAVAWIKTRSALDEAVPREEPGEQDLFPLLPGPRLTSISRLSKIRPWVEQTRRELEHRTGCKLPFSDYEDAVRWVLRQDKAARQRSPASTWDEAKALLDEAAPILSRLKALTGQPWHVQAEPLAVVQCVKPGDRSVDNIATIRGEPLHDLGRAVAEMSRATGFKEVDLVAYVLAGHPPRLQPVSIQHRMQAQKLPAGDSMWRSEITVTIRSPEVTTEAYFDAIRRAVWNEWPKRRPLDLTRKQQRMVNAFEQIGWPDRDNPTSPKYWRRFLEHVDPEGTTYAGKEPWRTPMMAWTRPGGLREKLENLEMSVEPVRLPNEYYEPRTTATGATVYDEMPYVDATDYVTDGERYGVRYVDGRVDWLGETPARAARGGPLI